MSTCTPPYNEECIIEYNTEYRTDHSVRNSQRTPFEVIDNCEANHLWHPHEVRAVQVDIRLTPRVERARFFISLKVKYLFKCLSFKCQPAPPYNEVLAVRWNTSVVLGSSDDEEENEEEEKEERAKDKYLELLVQYHGKGQAEVCRLV